jgi:hypothetical protein
MKTKVMLLVTLFMGACDERVHTEIAEDRVGRVCDATHAEEERVRPVTYGGGVFIHVIEICTALHRANKTVYAYEWVARR